MKKSYLFVIALVALIVGCKVSKPTTNQIGATIIEGSGVQGIRVGDKIDDVLKINGKPSKTDDEYYYFYDKGFEFTVSDNKVKTIFFYFISKKYQPFNGQTNKGIKKESSIEEVLEIYGDPERTGKPIMSSYSDFAGQEDYNMGLLCVSSSHELVHTSLGRKVSLGMGVFWGARLTVQFLGYSPALWRGKAFETAVHIVFSLMWLYLSAVFLWTGALL